MKNGARPKVNRQKTHQMYAPHGKECEMSRLHEDLKEFEEFRENTLKAIRKDISKGLSAADIRKKYLAILQGRLITDALTTQDVKEAIAIVKDVADRVEGKATEKREVTHRFENMSEQEIDAILKSEEEELSALEERFDQ